MGRILVVDDDADTAEMMATFLRKAGHQVRTTPNGREALAAISERMPDLAVLDLRMPEMDGISFLEVLKSYLRWESLPVILISGYPDDPRLVRAAQLGVKKTFLKADFRLQDVLDVVNQFAPPPAAKATGPDKS
jgi:CheY-like chemotaxis protein